MVTKSTSKTGKMQKNIKKMISFACNFEREGYIMTVTKSNQK